MKVILDFVYHSDYSPLLVFGFFGLNCLIHAWLRYLWWRKVQHMPHTLALAIVFVFLGVACIIGSLTISRRAVVDFSWLSPVAQVAWIAMQVAFIVATVLLRSKLATLGKE